MSKLSLSQELKWRGFVNQTTFANLNELDTKKWNFYHGYDAASADSLTIGNLAAVMLDRTFIRHGHHPVILSGGATSLIGDPGGKDAERQLQAEADVNRNVKAVQVQLEHLFNRKIDMVNNLSWLKDLTVLDFLRDIGKHFSMTPLVQRDYIANRMNEGGAGISYTEFSYTLLQGYDFLHLHQKNAVNLQLAGSDQWGNSLSGVDLVRKVTGKEVHALTMPLILDKSTGKKFGKSEAGAIWLDAKKTSTYQFYQFWLNVDDDSVSDYLKIFTELDKVEIANIMVSFEKDKPNRVAQKQLAFEVTKMVHGELVAESQKRIADVLFGNSDYLELGIKDFENLATELPVATVPKDMQIDNLIDAIVKTNLASSKTEARRFLSTGAIYVNNQQMPHDFHFMDGYAVIRRGKNKQAILKLNN